MAQELSISDWIEEIDRGLEYRRVYGLEAQWGQLEAMLYNVDPSQANAGPNIFISTLDALAASLSVPYPYMTVKARKSKTIKKARVLESIDNMLIDQMGLPGEVEKAVFSTFLWGKGFIKLGYDSEYGWDGTLDIGLGKPLGLTMTQFDRNHKRIEFGDVQPGMPWAKSVLPHDIVVPWGTYSIKTAPWYAHRVVRHIDSVRGDLKYAHTKNLRPNMSMEDFTKSYQRVNQLQRAGRTENLGRDEGGEEFVELWEIHDRATGRIMVMATGEDEHWLRNDPDALQINGLPLVELSFVPRARTFWVTPDAFYLKFHQAELSDIAVQTTKHRRLSVLKLLYDENAISATALDRLFSADVGAGVPIKTGFNLDTVVRALNVPSPNMQLYADSESIRRNAREQVGFSRNQAGEFESTGRRTAREVAEVAQAAGLRLDRRQNAIRCLYIDIFRHVNPIIFQNWKLPRGVEIIGDEGAPEFFNVTGEELDDVYDYKLGFSTGGQETLQERRQSSLQLYQMLSQDPRIDPMKLAQWLAAAINDPEFNNIFANGVLNGQASSGGAGGQPTSQGSGQDMGGGQTGGVQAAAGLGGAATG